MTGKESLRIPLLLLQLIMQTLTRLPQLSATARHSQVCSSNVSYVSAPPSVLGVCNPYPNLMLLCEVKHFGHSEQEIDMNWYFSADGVPGDTESSCPCSPAGLLVANSSTHSISKTWDPATHILSVRLTVEGLNETIDSGRYWCQASNLITGQTFSSSPAYCLHSANVYQIIPFKCSLQHISVQVCAEPLPLPSSVHSSSSHIHIQSSALSLQYSNFVISSFISPTTSLSTNFRTLGVTHTMQHSNSPSSSSPNDLQIIVILSAVFGAVGVLALTLAIILAATTVRWRRQAMELTADQSTSPGSSYSIRSGNLPTLTTINTGDTYSDSSQIFQIHQTVDNTSPQFMPLGPLAPSTMSTGSGLYSEIGPLQHSINMSSLPNSRPGLPERTNCPTTLEENLYDLPEMDESRSHTYSLPGDACLSTCGSEVSAPMESMTTSSSRYGMWTPVYIGQHQQFSQVNEEDVLCLPVDSKNRKPVVTQQTISNGAPLFGVWKESDSDTGSPTHSTADSFLSQRSQWVCSDRPHPHSSTGVETMPRSAHTSVDESDELRAAHTQHSSAGKGTSQAPPPPDSVPYQTVPHSDSGNSSPSPSASSGCTDLSKYSGEYERDPVYMEVLRKRAALAKQNSRDSEVSSGISSIYSPLSQVVFPPPLLEHYYTPLNCHSIHPPSPYAQLLKYGSNTKETYV